MIEMKPITILATGSRGDVQPFLALAVGLHRRGQCVRLVCNEIYAGLARSYGLEVATVTWDPRPAMRLQTRLGAERNPLIIIRRQMENTRSVYRQVQSESLEMCRGAGALLFSVLSPWGQTIAEQMGVPYLAGMLHPLEPTREFPMQLLPWNLGGGLNRLSHILAEHLLQLATGGEINRFRQTLGLAPQRFPQTLLGHLRAQNIPLLCNLSPTILPRPRDWPQRVHMYGYWFLPGPTSWSPPPALRDFLAREPAPVYIGFGSLASDDPRQTGQMVSAALTAIRRGGILFAGWGGLADTGADPRHLLLASDVPHDWLFERVGVVAHHGGAGTTAAALRAGVPQVLIPHMQDQFYWGKKMHALGVSPPPLERQHLNAVSLAAALRAACEDPALRGRAIEIGERIRGEQGLEKTLDVIEDYINSQ